MSREVPINNANEKRGNHKMMIIMTEWREDFYFIIPSKSGHHQDWTKETLRACLSRCIIRCYNVHFYTATLCPLLQKRFLLNEHQRKVTHQQVLNAPSSWPANCSFKNALLVLQANASVHVEQSWLLPRKFPENGNRCLYAFTKRVLKWWSSSEWAVEPWS